MSDYDVIVIGGGISGLSFAHYAAKAGMRPLVLEKEEKVGGSFDTAEFDGVNDGFWLELGAHTCYNSYQTLIEVMEDCGVASEIIPRAKVPFRVLDGRQVKSFMSQINFLELLLSLPGMFGKKKAGLTVEDYYGSILGKKNFKHIFSALFSAVPSQNADLFPADALFKKRQRRKDVLKHYTLKEGLASIARAVVEHHSLDVLLNTEVISIAKNDQGGYKVKTKNIEVESNQLAVCTSIPPVPKLLQDVAPDVAEQVSKVQYQAVESMAVLVEKEHTNLKPFAGLVPSYDVFYSVVSRDIVPHDRYRGFTFHFKPGVLSKEKKQDKICEVLHVSAKQLRSITEKQNIVPSLRLGHYELVDEVDRLLKGRNLYMAGNYFAGLSIEDCVCRAKSEAQRMLGR